MSIEEAYRLNRKEISLIEDPSRILAMISFGLTELIQRLVSFASGKHEPSKMPGGRDQRPVKLPTWKQGSTQKPPQPPRGGTGQKPAGR